jgi:hypothetical protein
VESAAGVSGAAGQPDRRAGNDGLGAGGRLSAFQPHGHARGAPGSLDGQSERNRMMVDNIDASIEMLVLVNPEVLLTSA